MDDVRRRRAVEFFGGRARLVDCAPVTDPRGSLTPFEFPLLPFAPRRVFAVTDVPAGAVRGGHAHREGTQLLVCLQGRIEVVMRLGAASERLILEPGGAGLLFGPGVWCQQRYLDEGTVLLAFASDPYDPASTLED